MKRFSPFARAAAPAPVPGPRRGRVLAPILAILLACVPAIAVAQQPAPEAAPTQEATGGTIAPAPATAPAPAPEVEALSPYITDVQVLGPWADGNQNGVWRTVLLQAAGNPDGNRFFVQQVAESEGQLSVLATTEITEIDALDGAIVNYRADEPTEDAPSTLSLFLDIVPLDGEIAETYELFITPGEPYTFGPASN